MNDFLKQIALVPQPNNPGDPWPTYSAELLETTPDVLEHQASDFFNLLEQSLESSAASIHAWRIWALQGGEDFLPWCLDTLEAEDDEWLLADLPQILSHLSESSWLQAFTEDDMYEEIPAFIFPFGLSKLLESLLKCELDEKKRVFLIPHLVRAVKSEEFSRSTRGYLVRLIAKWKAISQLGLVQSWYARNLVALDVAGDCEAFECELGVREGRSTPTASLNQLEKEARLKHRKKQLSDLEPSPDSSSFATLHRLAFLYRQDEKEVLRHEVEAHIIAALIKKKTDPSFLTHSLLGSEEGKSTPSQIFESKEENQEWESSLANYITELSDSFLNGNFLPTLPAWPDAELSNDPETPCFSEWTSYFCDQLLELSDLKIDKQLDTFLQAAKVIADIELEERILESDEDNAADDFFLFLEKTVIAALK